LILSAGRGDKAVRSGADISQFEKRPATMRQPRKESSDAEKQQKKTKKKNKKAQRGAAG